MMEYGSNKTPNWCTGGIFVHTVAKIFKIGQEKKANKKVKKEIGIILYLVGTYFWKSIVFDFVGGGGGSIMFRA